MDRRKFLKMGLIGIGAMTVADKSWALKYYPNESAIKWAVLYGTWCGSSRDAGVWISEGMGGIADVFDVRENPDLSGFDHLVVGGSIRSGQVSPELQSYLEANKSWMQPKIKGLFAVCGNMQMPVGPQQVTTYIDNHLASMTGAVNVPAKVFLGRVTMKLLDAEAASMLAGMSDYDNLSRAECLAFGEEILQSAPRGYLKLRLQLFKD